MGHRSSLHESMADGLWARFAAGLGGGVHGARVGARDRLVRERRAALGYKRPEGIQGAVS
jgi:hypothetical protein